MNNYLGKLVQFCPEGQEVYGDLIYKITEVDEERLGITLFKLTPAEGGTQLSGSFDKGSLVFLEGDDPEEGDPNTCVPVPLSILCYIEGLATQFLINHSDQAVSQCGISIISSVHSVKEQD